MNTPPRPPSGQARLRSLSQHPANDSVKSPEEPGTHAPIRVMIVDDSLTVRTIFRRMVEGDPAMEVAGTASSGERAVVQIKKEPADVVLLDLEMPGIGGLKSLPEILAASPGTQVLVVSSLTQDGAEATVEALSNGAADTLQKPRPGGFTEDYRRQLLSKIRALGGVRCDDASSNAQNGDQCASAPETGAESGSVSGSLTSLRSAPLFKHPEVIAIGASTGGIHAINLMLRELSPACSLPILITQHLPTNFIPVFARQIAVASGRPTQIAEDGTQIREGEIAIATGHGHLCVRRIADRLIARTSALPAASGCLPSVDPMLASLAETCEGRVLAIILSGMGRDGHEGAQKLVDAGGCVWAQNADSCAVWGMPGAVTKAGLASHIDTPEGLGQTIMAKFANSKVPAA